MNPDERWYAVHIDAEVTHVASAKEVLALIDQKPHAYRVWVEEGYADHREHLDHVEVVFRATRTVLPSTLRFEAERTRVQQLLAEMVPG